MSVDLMAYARAHRLRTRNLHDGAPVPPARRRGGLEHPAYSGPSDRFDAIIGRDGYVAMDGDRLSVFAAYRSARGLNAGLRRLTAAGLVVQQEGDTEVGGWAPVERIEEILAAIRVYRRKSASVGRSAGAMRALRIRTGPDGAAPPGVESTREREHGDRVPADAKKGRSPSGTTRC